MRFVKKSSFFSSLYLTGVTYPTPVNLTYFWNFGIYALVCLGIQILTGVFLAIHYVPDQTLAFFSVEHIMRDVQYGWLLRYMHANGASFFFIVVYFHLFRGLYYSSYVYPRRGLWNVGVILLLMMIVTAFLGYVLPWGQISFWAATVITNLLSAVPYMGSELVIWVWGEFSVGNSTLNRFFALHFLLPFLLVAFSGLHLVLLHVYRSNNPLGIRFCQDEVPFYPYYVVKDFYGVVFFFFFFCGVLFFFPNFLSHPDNYIYANSIVTPTHIVPEWYFLPFYAVLRAIPDKFFGILALLGSISSFFFLPYLVKSEVRSMDFRPVFAFFFWIFLVDVLLLGWLGSKPAEHPYVLLSQLLTFFYFSYFLIFLPFTSRLERFFWFD